MRVKHKIRQNRAEHQIRQNHAEHEIRQNRAEHENGNHSSHFCAELKSGFQSLIINDNRNSDA